MHRQERSETTTRPPEDDPIAGLLRLVGRRENVAPERTARVRTVIHAAWLEDVHRRRQRRRTYLRVGTLAVAALVLLALGITFRDRLAPPTRPAPGKTPAATGIASTGLPSLTVGDSVFAGARLDTRAEGRLALRLAQGPEGGPSVRLDAGTVVYFDSPSSLTLERGTVYIDTGDIDTGDAGTDPSALGRAAVVEVRTGFGVATDIGTQFEVRVTEGALRLRVREGEVRFDDERGATHTAAAGVELTVGAEGEVRRSQVALYGTPWAWIHAVAPRFDLDGRSLSEILDWTARETGWQVRFRDESAVRARLGEVLQGTVPVLRADQAVFQVLPTYGLEARLDDGILWIELF